MDSFEDLENPPISIQNVVNNRWLNNSFKETVRTESLALDLISEKLKFSCTLIFNKTVFTIIGRCIKLLVCSEAEEATYEGIVVNVLIVVPE